MSITIGTDDMRKKMGEILDCVRLRGDQFIIERKHSPVAALIPIKKLEALERVAKSFLLDFLSHEDIKISNKDLDKLLNKAKKNARSGKK